ncbi:ribosomal protein S18-alanine N-acetyltransferase [Vagococcus lutrae]|uniref:ribosomal protein S18-alanine N-acetyltransferase n=1 Tax=Vagococcus lutrae TaxID=81947 RepID=UPI00288F053B|nr:ribosomal protein S18-alanine N-acetyltransferase [Vagococcus lutrae]MDT2825312.1 ribosomal protein S18-alanine N-acetyltransferase [Vagococcus lutrae]
MMYQKIDLEVTSHPLLSKKLLELSEKAYPHGSPWNVSQFEQEWSLSYSHLWLAYDQQQVIGFLNIHVLADEAEVMNIAVLPSYRGQKVAQTLFKYSLDFCQSVEVSRMFLEVRVTNWSAKHLYQKVGFNVIGTRKQYYAHPTEDGEIMEIKLNKVKT